MGVHDLVPKEKPAMVWCTHCKIGKGCSIYDSRPASCRSYACMWLQGSFPENAKPDRIKAAFATCILDIDGESVTVIGCFKDSSSTDVKDRRIAALVTAVIDNGYPLLVVAGDARKLLFPDSVPLDKRIKIRDALYHRS